MSPLRETAEGEHPGGGAGGSEGGDSGAASGDSGTEGTGEGTEPIARDEEMARRRQRLLRLVEAQLETLREHRDREKIDRRVLDVMARVPRHEFVPASQRELAYDDTTLPIGHGQTISQPSLVAIMTALLRLESDDVVLEVGTGSGYQTAILAELAEFVYSVETIGELASEARERLDRLGYENVQIRVGDGYEGWAEKAPFDAVIVTAAALDLPPPLLDQLRPGGRMVLPIGGGVLDQMLFVVEKDASGRTSERPVLPVVFVPLVHRREAAAGDGGGAGPPVR